MSTPDLSILNKKEIVDAARHHFSISHLLRSSRASVVGYVEEKADEVLKSELAQMIATKTRGLEVKRQDRIHAKQKRKKEARTERNKRRKKEEANEEDDSARYLELPTPEEAKAAHKAFHLATSSAALALAVCAICARQKLEKDGGFKMLPLTDIPNPHRLTPRISHVAHSIYGDGMLLEPEGVTVVEGLHHARICAECMKELCKNVDAPPDHSLANNLWVGKVPWQLAALTVPEQLLIAHAHPHAYVYKLYPRSLDRRVDDSSYQRGIRGNVTTFALDTTGMADMVMGRKFPRLRSVLPSLISIVFISRGKLPRSCLRNLFKVRRQAIRDALEWLKLNNPKYYGHIVIDEEVLQSLPEDDVPDDLLDIVRHSEDVGMVEEERAGYVNEDEEGKKHWQSKAVERY